MAVKTTESSDSSSTPKSKPRPKPVICVADADLILRRLLIQTLDSAGGFEFCEATTRISLDTIIEERKPDLLLLGVYLAGQGGLVTLRQLKKNPATKDLPIIFCVDRPNHPSVEEALDAGAVDYVSKQFMNQLLIRRIECALHPPTPAVSPAAAIEEIKPPSPIPQVEAKPPTPVSGFIKILVVEDTAIMRHILTRALQREGSFEIVEAETGEAALKKLKDEAISLVLLDINLPDIGGLELLERIKSEPQTHAVPVIMCTSRRDEEAISKAIALGAADYIIKPIITRVLVSKVRVVLNLSP